MSPIGDAVQINNLPSYIPQAIIATEDRRFYKHHGIDIIGIVRAFIRNMKAGRIVQGGVVRFHNKLQKIYF